MARPLDVRTFFFQLSSEYVFKGKCNILAPLVDLSFSANIMSNLVIALGMGFSLLKALQKATNRFKQTTLNLEVFLNFEVNHSEKASMLVTITMFQSSLDLY